MSVRLSVDSSTRWRGYIVGVGAVVLTALPVFWRAERDSFPLSTYPMFARWMNLGPLALNIRRNSGESGLPSLSDNNARTMNDARRCRRISFAEMRDR